MINRPRVEFDWEAFGRDLRATLTERMVSTRMVAAAISIAPATVCRATQDRPVNVETMFSLCDWMDVEAAHYCRRSE